jgi:diketogulonate reductase-like aldo/keto reductase
MDKKLSESTILKAIAEKYDKNIGQIILKWHIDTGIVPIFTSTKEQRIIEYTELFDFGLDEEEIAKISALNINYKIYLESCFCPGF